MCDGFSSIWLEVGLPRQKRILVCQAYREWQSLGQGKENTSHSVPEQLSRLLGFLDQWDMALNSGLEVLTLGGP